MRSLALNYNTFCEVKANNETPAVHIWIGLFCVEADAKEFIGHIDIYNEGILKYNSRMWSRFTNDMHQIVNQSMKVN